MSLKASKWAKYIIQWRRKTLKANLSVRFLLFGKSSKVTIMMGHLGFPGLIKVFYGLWKSKNYEEANSQCYEKANIQNYEQDCCFCYALLLRNPSLPTILFSFSFRIFIIFVLKLWQLV